MRVLIISAAGVEDLELWYPYLRMKEERFEVVLASPDKQEIRGKYGMTIKPNAATSRVKARDFDALILPGGRAPEIVRMDKHSLQIVKDFMKAAKPVAAICHGPQILISAGVLQGRHITSWPALRDDMRAAGARWEDREVVVDDNLVTSRQPEDLPAFCREAIKLFHAAASMRRKAA